MRTTALGILIGAALAAPARADRSADAVAVDAIRDYYVTLRPGEDAGITSVRDRLVPVMKDLGPKVGKSVRNVIRRGFDKKYGKDLPYLRCLCEILAAGGRPGINLLYKQYRSSRGEPELRRAMAEVLGACGDDEALDPLLKMMHDKEPAVAAAAVRACARHARVEEDERKAAAKKLVRHYSKVTDAAAGKAADTKEMQMYRALKPEMDATLAVFTGQALDSAAAFDAWLAENLSEPWSTGG